MNCGHMYFKYQMIITLLCTTLHKTNNCWYFSSSFIIWMHYVGYCIKSFVVVSAVGFPDILNYIMHPLSNKYIQKIIVGKLYMIILLRNSYRHCIFHSTTFCTSFDIDHHLYSVSRDTLMYILYILYICYMSCL